MKDRVVLLIDDETHVISSLKRLLRKEPYTLVTTTDPKRALRIIDTLRVALVITDRRMAGIDGDELVGRIMAKAPGVKCIMFTGYSDSMDGSSSSGVWKVIAKPWNDDEVKETIMEALRGTADEGPAIINSTHREDV
jgi:DNA-binding NtrC family response regulator